MYYDYFCIFKLVIKNNVKERKANKDEQLIRKLFKMFYFFSQAINLVKLGDFKIFKIIHFIKLRNSTEPAMNHDLF